MSALYYKFTGISFSSIPFDVNKPFKLIVEKYSGINPPSPIEIKPQRFSINCLVNAEDDILPNPDCLNNLPDDDDEISLDFDSQPTTSDSSTDDEITVPKRSNRIKDKVSLVSSKSRTPKNQNRILSDPLLQLQTKVHVLKLPDFIINSKLPARKLDEIYSHQSDNLFERNIDFVHRHIPKYNQCDDSDEDEFFLNAPSDLIKNNQKIQINFDDDSEDYEESDKSTDKTESSKVKKRVTRSTSERKKRKRVLINDTDESDISDTDASDITEINFNDDDNDSIEEITELETTTIGNIISLRKRKFQRTKKQRMDYIQLSSDDDKETDQVEIQEEETNTEGSGSQKKVRKNIKRVLTEAELENETKEATSKERKRVERIIEQEKQYARLLPEIEKDVEEPSLILDIDIETKKIRVEVTSLLVKELKPHQLDGIKFLYNSTIENVTKLKEEGSGCILAHCMGLGKSLQVITFVHTLLANPLTKVNIKTILIVVPVNTLKNWAEEFDKWITKKGLKCFNVYEMVDEPDVMRKAQLVENWSNSGGILIIGIPGLATLLNLNVPRKKAVSATLVQIVEKHLCDPGPDMLIIDEGHLLKDHKTRICKSVDRIKTKRKIVLTGTPLQNNLDEYHTMISIIKPRLLGSKKEFANRFRNPIENGQKADSNSHDVRLMKQRSTILNKLLSGCIQRFGYETLKPYLKPKLEYTIFIRPSKRMAEMYNFYLDQVQKDRLLWDATTLRLCVNHPALYQLQADSLRAKQEAAGKQRTKNKKLPIPEDLRPIGNSSKTGESNGNNTASSSVNKLDQPSTSKAVNTDQVDDENCPGTIEQEATENIEPEDNSLKKDWYKQFSQPDDWKNIELSGKFIILFKILKACITVGDKLLVVSQSLETLDLIEKCLQFNKEVDINNEKVNLSWKRGRNYYRIDGANSAHERLYQIRQFNDPKNNEARLFLLSTKAGGVGINLIAANRCVIFDVSWNPSDDIQAIFRVYRFGQPKPVYVYRFVTKDTMEEKIFRKQIVKLGMSIRVIDKHQVKRAFKAAELAEFYAARPKEEYEVSLPDVPQDRLLADILHIDNKEVLECMEFDSLLEKKPEEELTEEERQTAWAEYQKERDAEIKAAEERKQALAAEHKKSEQEMMAALQAEEERMNLENQRKQFEESVAAEKEKTAVASSSTTLTVAPTAVTTTLAYTPSTSTSTSTSASTESTSKSRNKTVSSAPKQQTSALEQDKLPAQTDDIVSIEKQLMNSSSDLLLDANPSNNNNHNNNKKDGRNVEGATATNKSVQNTAQIEEITVDTETGPEQSTKSLGESNLNIDGLTVRTPCSNTSNFMPQLVHNLNRHRTAFAYKALARPRPAILNLSNTRTQRKRKSRSNNETSLKQPTAKRNVRREEREQVEIEATKNAIDNAFQNRRVYTFENASTSTSASKSDKSRPVSPTISTSTTKSSATLSRTSSGNNNLTISGRDNVTRTIHQPNSDQRHMNQPPPRLRDQGPYSILYHHSSNQYPCSRSGSGQSLLSTSSSQSFPPPQGLASSSSSAFTGVSPGGGAHIHNRTNQNVISTYIQQPSQLFRDYGGHHQPLPPHQHTPYHHTSSPYLSNRPFTDAPPNFDQSSQQVRRLSYPNGNSTTSSQPVVQPIDSFIDQPCDNQNNCRTSSHSTSPISSNLPLSPNQPISSTNQIESLIVPTEMTDDMCDEILNKFADINLATCSFSDLVQKLLTFDGVLVDSAECAETIIIEIEKILTALNRKKDELHSKSCIDLLSEVEVIEKINCERMLENLRKQVDSIATADHFTDDF